MPSSGARRVRTLFSTLLGKRHRIARDAGERVRLVLLQGPLLLARDAGNLGRPGDGAALAGRGGGARHGRGGARTRPPLRGPGDPDEGPGAVDRPRGDAARVRPDLEPGDAARGRAAGPALAAGR